MPQKKRGGRKENKKRRENKADMIDYLNVYNTAIKQSNPTKKITSQ
jgi:hypothetical protein